MSQSEQSSSGGRTPTPLSQSSLDSEAGERDPTPPLTEPQTAGMWDSLRHRDYRFLWSGSLAASFAMNIQMVARGWLVYAMTSSPTKLAWVMLSFMVPQVIFSLFGGVVADRFAKKKVIAVAQALNCGATLIMAVIILSDNVTFWHFIYFGCFNGTVLALSIPARNALIPEIVGERLLFNAMALSTSSMNLSRILGPALAGVFIAVLADGNTTSTFGVGIVYLVIALLYFTSSALILFVNTRQRKAAKDHQNPFIEIRDGFRYVRASPILMGLIIMSILPFVFGMAINSLMPAFNQDILNGGPDGLGLLMSATGVGAIAGSLLLANMTNARHKGRWLFVMVGVWAMFIALFSQSVQMWTAMIMVAVVGFTSSLFMAMNRSLIQLGVSADMRGRVLSIDMMSHGLMPLGIIPISFIAESWGIDLALLISAVLLACSSMLVAVFLPVVRGIDRGFEMQASRAP